MKKKLKRLLISPEAFMAIMKNESAWKVSKGVPKGAIVKGITLDPYTQVICLFIEDSSFDPVDVYSVAPVLETEFKKIK